MLSRQAKLAPGATERMLAMTERLHLDATRPEPPTPTNLFEPPGGTIHGGWSDARKTTLR